MTTTIRPIREADRAVMGATREVPPIHARNAPDAGEPWSSRNPAPATTFKAVIEPVPRIGSFCFGAVETDRSSLGIYRLGSLNWPAWPSSQSGWGQRRSVAVGCDGKGRTHPMHPLATECAEPLDEHGDRN